MSAAVTPVEPKLAASVVLVRPSPPGAPEPIEVYMIRRQRSMKFLGGFYAFPGGKVDPADGSPAALARCHGLDTVGAEMIFRGDAAAPAFAFWVAAVRELLEETSEGFWIHPGLGYRRFLADEMTMAEPAEYGLAWLAQFGSIEDLWEAHADGRHKFHGIVDRIDVFWQRFDWKQNRFPT